MIFCPSKPFISDTNPLTVEKTLVFRRKE